ncbi:hypothetical protein SMICM17S_06392 [Streptomyces microflavus]
MAPVVRPVSRSPWVRAGSACVLSAAGTDAPVAAPVVGGEPDGLAAVGGMGVPSALPGGVTGGTRSAPVDGAALFDVEPVFPVLSGVCVMMCPVPR